MDVQLMKYNFNFHEWKDADQCKNLEDGENEEKLVQEELEEIEKLEREIAEDDEEFYDAEYEASPADCPTLEESLDQMREAVTLYFSNHFLDAFSLGDLHSNHSIYHSGVKSIMVAFGALLNMEKSELDRASKYIYQTVYLCNQQKRSTSFLTSWTKFFWATNYDNYTDLELHADLMYVHAILVASIVEFIQNQSVINLIKAAIRVKIANSYYKEGIDILMKKTNWKSKESWLNYQAGTRIGNGLINLITSHLPNSFLKLVRLVGFNGNREYGLQNLQIVAGEPSALTDLAKVIYMAYQCFAETLFGLGPDNLDEVEKYLTEGLKKCPDGAWYWFFKGKVDSLKGNLDDAIESYRKGISSQSEFLQLHYASYWEMSWCYAWKCDWDRALDCSKQIGYRWNLSTATLAFEEASFLYMKMIEEENHELKNKVAEIYRSVPSLTRRYGGRRITGEKIAAESAIRFFEQDQTLCLPYLENAYIWNKMCVMNGKKEYVDKILFRIDNILKNKGYKSIDEYAYLLFYKGICHRYEKDFDEAINCFNEILDIESQLNNDLGIAPQTCLELGLINLELELLEKARDWLNMTMSYHNYWSKIIVHMRVQRAKKKITLKEQYINDLNSSSFEN